MTPRGERRCKHCHVEVREFDHGAGPELLHIATAEGLAPGQPYKQCRPPSVAEVLTLGEAIEIARLVPGVHLPERIDE